MAKKTISSADSFQDKMPKAGSQKASDLSLKLIAACLVLSLLAAIMSIFVGIKVAKFDSIGSDLQLAVSRMGIVSGETQEDDVTISDLYTVRSTQAISKAYLADRSTGLDAKQKEVLDLASATLKNIIKEDMTTFQKEKAVYNWMCKNLEMAETSQVNIPVSSSQIDEPYGVLKTGTGVPVGFATTFRMFMEMLEIPCKVVHDTAFTNAWNMVQLDDENWYHVDVGSDITYGNFENFNMNENVASYKHTWDTEFFPAAAGTKYCYALMKAGEVKDLYNIPTRIKKAYDKKRKCIFLKFKTSSGKDLEVVDELVSRTADYLGGNLSQNADTTENAEAGGRGVADAVCIKMEDYYMLGVFFADGSQKNAGLTEKDFNKISKAVEKAFPAVG
ncbi:MAG: transglutaminase domain-containing protein [Clostridiales bacterium]|nr:transglutaminase domain-containing protein [Clostridia bacterium]MEE1292849.1 transglutaminase-like domain-containing protein [Acutalibacteraceae bacterium]NLD30306.1 transglutaminase domain-containing protein [Clostridiales bacterium]